MSPANIPVPRHILTACLGLVVALAVLPVVLLVLAARGFDGICSYIERRLRRARPTLIFPTATTFDARLGFRFKPNLDCYFRSYQGSDPFVFQTGPDGWPGRASLDECDVIVVGDSFAAGNGVDSDRTYYANARHGPRIKPLACAGYSMVQGLQLINDLQSQHLRDRLLVWLICLGNDLADNWSPGLGTRRVPFARLDGSSGQWQIVTEHIGADGGGEEPWTASLGRTRSQATRVAAVLDYYRDCYASQRGYRIAAELIKAAATHVRHGGGTLAVFATPYRPLYLPAPLLRHAVKQRGVKLQDYSLSYADARLRAICESAGVAYQSGLELLSFRDFLGHGEDHWNERGHRRFRDWLSRQHAQLWRTRAHPDAQPSRSAVGVATGH